jgi:hypothetical protein
LDVSVDPTITPPFPSKENYSWLRWSTPEAGIIPHVRLAVVKFSTLGSRKNNSGGKGSSMAESVYKVIELIGSSTESWEKAAAVALETASKSLRDLRVAEVEKFDIHIENGKPVFRTKLSVSFKYHTEK